MSQEPDSQDQVHKIDIGTLELDKPIATLASGLANFIAPESAGGTLGQRNTNSIIASIVASDRKFCIDEAADLIRVYLYCCAYTPTANTAQVILGRIEQVATNQNEWKNPEGKNPIEGAFQALYEVSDRARHRINYLMLSDNRGLEEFKNVVSKYLGDKDWQVQEAVEDIEPSNTETEVFDQQFLDELQKKSSRTLRINPAKFVPGLRELSEIEDEPALV